MELVRLVLIPPSHLPLQAAASSYVLLGAPAPARRRSTHGEH